MTNYEFEAQYQKLAEAYPEIYGKKFRKEIIAQCVRDLDLRWFSNLVNRLLLNPYLKFDFDEAARNERIAKSRIKATQDETQAIEALKSKMTASGYEELLKKYNAKSLTEALDNFKKEEEK